uniref:GapR-like DNA-binding domain-containing protein n=1 Tax=Magnetococcus massalia (strain MO-1) TaxID=451514 RepID=A0A1S7LL64_MAGMO|nr:conserved hypothetical protein [Candidatus Magnetococcus massalia]
MTAPVKIDPSESTEVQGVAGEVLQQYIERIERLEEEKANISQDVRDIYAEAKSNGFDAKVMRELIKIRKMEQHELDEKESLLHLYRQALGML